MCDAEITKIDIKSLELSALTLYMKEMGEPSFRAKQVYEWIHKKMVTSFDDMTNLPLKLRERLKEECQFTVLKEITVRVSKIDGTRKYLFALPDGNIIETVLMQYKHGNSICISSQVGCRMGCRFCASTIDGLLRNLTPAEMLEQVYRIQIVLSERISHLVVMGAGEPMDNYKNLLTFIYMLTDSNGLHISQRNITVSTCGLVPQIRALAEEKLAITLALSLHAPNDEIRKSLMPIANRYSLKEVLDSCRYYFEKTGRRVTFEYSLVSGVNDNEKEARKLIALLKNIKGHINLIPVNPIKERDYKQSTPQAVLDFKKLLEKNKINVTIRREMGRDIEGACGQLRRHYIKEEGV